MFILRRDAQVAVAATAQALGLSSEMIAIFDKNLMMLQSFQTQAVDLNNDLVAKSKPPILPADSVAEPTASECTSKSHSIGDENEGISPDIGYAQRIGAVTGHDLPSTQIPECQPECFFLDSDAEDYAKLKDISDKFDIRLAKLEEDRNNDILDMNDKLSSNERWIGVALMVSSKDTLDSSREIAGEYQSLMLSKFSEMEDSLSKKCSMVTDLAKQMEALLELYAEKLNDYEGDTYYENTSHDLQHLGELGSDMKRKKKPQRSSAHLATSACPVASTLMVENGIGKNKSSSIGNNKSSSGIGHERGSMFAKT
jgi:hypothetical protein